ncbi:MAG: hypothetical protein VX747_02125, partial [Actinomycetota bacterium]|nr:hypothetical protein [Actinomycetota bacterium]
MRLSKHLGTVAVAVLVLAACDPEPTTDVEPDEPTPSACPEGFFALNDACEPHTPCADDTFETVAPTETSDR